MLCPIDGSELVMSDRQGIEIDYCPKCRGIWLDRGELDKLIERSTDDSPPPQYTEQRRGSDERRYDDDRHHGSHRPRKKKSLLGDIFDF